MLVRILLYFHSAVLRYHHHFLKRTMVKTWMNIQTRTFLENNFPFPLILVFHLVTLYWEILSTITWVKASLVPVSGFYGAGRASLPVVSMHVNKCLFILKEKWNLTYWCWYARPFIIELRSTFLVLYPSTYPSKAHSSIIPYQHNSSFPASAHLLSLSCSLMLPVSTGSTYWRLTKPFNTLQEDTSHLPQKYTYSSSIT